MFAGPVRGGTRGGQAEFSWNDVSADKDRENYLGHSVFAPVGRWQKNKDVNWYNKDLQDEQAREEELRKIKEAESDALAVALGFKPEPKRIPLPEGVGSSHREITADVAGSSRDAAEEAERKAEKLARKKEREERRARKEERRREKGGRDRSVDERDRDRNRERERERSRDVDRDDRSRDRRRDRDHERYREDRVEHGGSRRQTKHRSRDDSRDRERDVRDERRRSSSRSRSPPRRSRRDRSPARGGEEVVEERSHKGTAAVHPDRLRMIQR